MKWTLILTGVLAMALVALPLAGGGTSKSSGTATPTVGSIRAEINRIRRHAHLEPLKLDQAASLVAAAHSRSMAQTGRLVPVPNKTLAPFVHRGRNDDVYQVVVSFSGRPLPSTAQVVSYMMRAHHGRARRRAFLNPNHNRVGIGIARRPSSFWVTAIFITVPK